MSNHGPFSWDDWEGDPDYQDRKADAEREEWDRRSAKEVQGWTPDHRYREVEALAGVMHWAEYPGEDDSHFEHSFERSGHVRSTRYGKREDGGDWTEFSLF